MLPADAPPEKAKELGKRCRDLGLEPVMMFSGIYPEHKNALEVFKNRIKQAAAAGVPQVLTFGHTTRGQRASSGSSASRSWARSPATTSVLIVVKQHGGETGTGAACAEIIREVNDESIKVNYDAGNVMDYLRDKVDPIADFKKCAERGPQFLHQGPSQLPADRTRARTAAPASARSTISKLLAPVAFTGLDDAAVLREHLRPVRAAAQEARGRGRLARDGHGNIWKW